VILETLTDLLAEPALLPDLFYNYDCDTQRTDVLESLVRALADCCKVRASSPPPASLPLEAPCLTLVPLGRHVALFPSTLSLSLFALFLSTSSFP